MREGMTTTRLATTTAVLSLLFAAAPGCGPSDAGDGPEASDIGTDSAAIDSSFLPKQFQVRWAPGIPGPTSIEMSWIFMAGRLESSVADG